MGRVESYDRRLDPKSRLVVEICNISNRAISCAHWHRHENNITSPFIDWYLLLQIEENVGIDTIRKKYHKFALQLHPDKNKHPKAEFAFKLVSEAYACLSDEARRAAFDSERLNSFCSECSRIPRVTCTPPGKSHTKVKGSFPSERLRPNKILERVKDIKARFMEEARVIGYCLKTNATTGTESTTSNNASEKKRFRLNPYALEKKEFPVFNPYAPEKKDFPVFNPYALDKQEFPVFNPSDYLSQGYPHLRERRCKRPDNLQWLWTGNPSAREGNAKCDSPIFECKPKRSPFRFKSFVGTYSNNPIF